jgi:hypothetical protein
MPVNIVADEAEEEVDVDNDVILELLYELV